MKILGLGGGGMTPGAQQGAAISNAPGGLAMGDQFEQAMAGGITPQQAGTGTVSGAQSPFGGILKDLSKQTTATASAPVTPVVPGKIVPPLPPLKLPEYSPGGSLQGLLQAIEQRRARLAALGTGMMGGFGG